MEKINAHIQWQNSLFTQPKHYKQVVLWLCVKVLGVVSTGWSQRTEHKWTELFLLKLIRIRYIATCFSEIYVECIYKTKGGSFYHGPQKHHLITSLWVINYEIFDKITPLYFYSCGILSSFYTAWAVWPFKLTFTYCPTKSVTSLVNRPLASTGQTTSSLEMMPCSRHTR